jgi:hypothetical protein
MRKIFIIYLFFIFQIGFSQKYQNLAGTWTTKTFPNFIYHFDSSDNVRFKWSNDLGSYSRTGKYYTSFDTIVIEYEPLFYYKTLNKIKGDTLKINILNKHYEKLAFFGIKVKYLNNQSTVFQSDSNGLILIPGINKIDSLILEDDYIGSTMDSREKLFRNRFYSFRINQLPCDSLTLILDEYLMSTYNFKSNREYLLRISKRRIYVGIDYNPNMIYIGGILTKEK